MCSVVESFPSMHSCGPGFQTQRCKNTCSSCLLADASDGHVLQLLSCCPQLNEAYSLSCVSPKATEWGSSVKMWVCAQHAEVGLAGPVSETQNSGASGLGFEVRARC